MSAIVQRAGLCRVCAAAAIATLLVSCARDPIVTGMDATTVGSWRVEKGTDRITGAPISSAILVTYRVSTTKIIVPPAAQMQLTCFKQEPTAVFRFQFKIGSTRNAEFGYRFDDKPGHIANARFVDDYKSVIIEDKEEMARFVGEMTTSKMLYVLIRSITVGRTSAEFPIDGAPTAINAALAGCPINAPPQGHASDRSPPAG